MRVGIVGGGVVGSAAAMWLSAAGHDVTLYEAEPEGAPASAGNAGLIALPEILPMARPGILRQVPRWLADPLGPLTLRWRDAPALAPWLAAFLRASTAAGVARSTEALATLMATALDDHRELARRAGLPPAMQRTGALSLHDSEASLIAAEASANAVRRRLGCRFERLSEQDARALAPALEGRFAGAIHAHDYWTVEHPRLFLDALRGRVRETARMVPQAVGRVERGADGPRIVTADGSAERFDAVLIAAGIASRDLLRGLGARVLLAAERGYNTTFENPSFALPLPLVFADHGFVATPLGGALRVGGAVELAAPDAPPNFARARAMRQIMRRYVPRLPERGGVEWMGRRPSTPDSLPVIGRLAGEPRILMAFGHGHLGLTLAAVTARHVARLVAGEPAGDLHPFRVERFR